jgi:hypothetical protein
MRVISGRMLEADSAEGKTRNGDWRLNDPAGMRKSVRDNDEGTVFENGEAVLPDAASQEDAREALVEEADEAAL